MCHKIYKKTCILQKISCFQTFAVVARTLRQRCYWGFWLVLDKSEVKDVYLTGALVCEVPPMFTCTFISLMLIWTFRLSPCCSDSHEKPGVPSMFFLKNSWFIYFLKNNVSISIEHVLQKTPSHKQMYSPLHFSVFYFHKLLWCLINAVLLMVIWNWMLAVNKNTRCVENIVDWISCFFLLPFI